MQWQKLHGEDIATSERNETEAGASGEGGCPDSAASSPGESRPSPGESRSSPGESRPSPRESRTGARLLATSHRVHARSGLLDLAHLREERDVDWTLPWSDLMMTMFVLFVTLYLYEVQTYTKDVVREPSLPSFLELPAESGFAPADEDSVTHISRGWGESGYLRVERGEESTLQRPGDAAETADVEELRLADIDDLHSVDLVRKRAYRIVLTGDVLFNGGKAKIRAEALPVLRKTAAMIGSTPYMVNVVGHTDSTPIHSKDYPSNWELSLARAAVIARFLIDRLDVPASQFYVTGHADNRPIAGNATPADRAKNRRVEIVVTREIPSGGADGVGATHER